MWAAAGMSVPTPSYTLSAVVLVQPCGDMRPGADPTGTEQVSFLFWGLASFSGRSVCVPVHPKCTAIKDAPVNTWLRVSRKDNNVSFGSSM